MRRLLGFVLLSLLLLSPRASAQTETEKQPPPKLVVLMVFDQFRGDYLARWRELFDKNGFERLLRDGAWFDNCHYDYAQTLTSPGHSSLVTGCGPNKHGIIGTEWYDRDLGREITAVESDRYLQVPLITPPDAGKRRKEIGAWPGRRLQPTVGDVLHRVSAGKGKVVSLSLKARAAILLANLLAFACYWFDSLSGAFVTSTYYRETPHAWVAEFNQSKTADRWFGKDWERLQPKLNYDLWSGPDDAAGESKGYGQGKTFPHPMTGGLNQPGPAYYDALTNSPFGNDLLLALAKRAIDAEQLGQDDIPDLLCLSFSSNDIIGHVWGPDSHEVLDVTLRTDRLIQDLLQYLDAKVGAGNYAVVLSADHGVCPLPEATLAKGQKAGRIVPQDLQRRANAFLDQTFAHAGANLPWVEAVAASALYLSPRIIGEQKVAAGDVERALASWLVKQEGIQTAYTRADMISPPVKKDPLLDMVRKSYFPHRSGEVVVVLEPYWLLTSYLNGTTHGTPHAYDTHVPLLVYGPGIRPGTHKQRITPLAAAPILSHFLRIPAPAGAEVSLPAVLEK